MAGLTRLRFKNWRSLKDVEIDNLTPLTVFIGANSSGKTNILDALRFMQRSATAGFEVAVYNWQGLEKIRFLKADPDEHIELEIDFDWDKSTRITDRENLTSGQAGWGGGRVVYQAPVAGQVIPDDREQINRLQVLGGYSSQFKRDRWQLLRENMMALVTVPSDSDLNYPWVIDPLGRNVPLMLDFMKRQYPQVYIGLQADLSSLLDHVGNLETMRDERETRFLIHEHVLDDREAPTISAGTARIVAILTAYYALDMRNAEQPGLVAIEEPDMAVHPLLLEKLVDLLRSYTEREHPRQFILTTHNPQILNYFEPHEVRIVERDSDGITTVKPVDEKVAEVWRNHEGAFNLGKPLDNTFDRGCALISRTLRLISEDPSDAEILDEIQKKQSIGIIIEPVLMPDNRWGINLLPQQLPKLIDATRTAFPDDVIAVLIDAEWYKPKRERHNHKLVAAICRESRPRVKLLWAVQETEAWILADSGICAWLGIDVEKTDQINDPKETLASYLRKKKGRSWRSHDRKRVLQELRGDGDEHNTSLGRVLRFMRILLR